MIKGSKGGEGDGREGYLLKNTTKEIIENQFTLKTSIFIMINFLTFEKWMYPEIINVDEVFMIMAIMKYLGLILFLKQWWGNRRHKIERKDCVTIKIIPDLNHNFY